MTTTKFNFLVLLAFIFPASYVTAEGWQLILNELGVNLSLWKAYVFSLGFSFIRSNPFANNKKPDDFESVELFATVVTAFVFDVLAVYLLLPYALGL